MKKIFVMIVCFCGLFLMSNHSEAASIHLVNDTCEKGNDIYCSYNMGGLRMGIVKIDKKTKEISKVVSFYHKNKPTNGFSDLNIKGNAIYAGYDMVCGTGSSDSYIYKIDVKKKTKKKLGKGKSPVVIGKKIYYIKTKFNKKYDEDLSVGIYRMDLSGKHNKKICKMPFKWVEQMGTDGTHIIIGKYGDSGMNYYQMNKNGKSLKKIKLTDCNYLKTDIKSGFNQKGFRYFIQNAAVVRKNLTTGEEEELIDFGTGDFARVENVVIYRDVIMVRGSRDEYIEEFGYNGGKGYIFMIDLSNLEKTVVETYNCGE